MLPLWFYSIMLAFGAWQDAFVCPPCGRACDQVQHEQAGSCPKCGMVLVSRSSNSASAPAPEANLKRVGILIFAGVQIIDYTGPYEVFGQAHTNVFTVAEKSEPVVTAMGMTVTPAYSFGDCPPLDVLVLPGGDPPLDNAQVIGWIKERVATTEHVLSVCNGAFLLARAGLLDGLGATTFYGLLDDLARAAPKATVHRDKRFVDNGKIVTSAGLSSGIDGALHVVAKMFGFGRAQAVALNMEYDWRPDSRYARGSFADVHLRKMLGQRGFALEAMVSDWTVLEQQGDQDHWQKHWSFRSQASPAELMGVINAKMNEGWTQVEASEGASRWTFKDDSNGTWHGTATLVRDEAKRDLFRLAVRIERG